MLEPFFNLDAWSIAIKWSPPMAYSLLLEKESRYDKPHQLFLLSSQINPEQYTINLVGHTYDLSFRKLISLQQNEEWHISNQNINLQNPLFVSHGAVTVRNGKKTDQQLMDGLVSILQNVTFQAANLIPNGSYSIKNTGSKGLLPQKIMIGMFFEPGVKTRRRNLWG